MKMEMATLMEMAQEMVLNLKLLEIKIRTEMAI